MSASVRPQRGASEIVIALEGEIDLSNAADVEAEIRQALDDESRIVIDLTRAAYIDSAGARLLFALARSLGERLSVVIPDESPLLRVLTLVGLPKVVPIVSRPSEKTTGPTF